MRALTAGSGRQRLGRYRLLARLGAGGMAEVLLARRDDAGDDGPLVAIKRMRPELSHSTEFVELFVAEARTASSLVHPNICQVHELGEDRGLPFIVLEYLDGVPLSSVFAQQLADPRGWDVGVLAGMIAQACEGLQHAHDALDAGGVPLGIIHRDVSPPNLFVTEAGVVKVLDFGISKSRASAVRTMTGQIRGKFAYMSPEQLRGESLDRRSDVFSLAIVLCELLVGQRLFRRANRLEVFKAIVREPMPSVRALRADLPDLLVDVVDRALARDRDERFDNARAFGAALIAAAREVGGAASPAEIGARVAERFAAELDERRRLVADPPGVDLDAAEPVTAPTRALRQLTDDISEPGVSGPDDHTAVEAPRGRQAADLDDDTT